MRTSRTSVKSQNSTKESKNYQLPKTMEKSKIMPRKILEKLKKTQQSLESMKMIERNI